MLNKIEFQSFFLTLETAEFYPKVQLVVVRKLLMISHDVRLQIKLGAMESGMFSVDVGYFYFFIF